MLEEMKNQFAVVAVPELFPEPFNDRENDHVLLFAFTSKKVTFPG